MQYAHHDTPPPCPKRWVKAKEMEQILVTHGFEEGRRTAKNFRQWFRHDGNTIRRVSISSEQQREGIPPAVVRALWRDAGWVRLASVQREAENAAPGNVEPPEAVEAAPERSSPEEPAKLAHDPVGNAVRMLVETMRQEGVTMVLVDLDAELIRLRREEQEPLPALARTAP